MILVIPQFQIPSKRNAKDNHIPRSLNSPDWKEHDDNLEEVIRLSKEDLKDLNFENELKEIDRKVEGLKEIKNDGYFDESDFVEEPILRRRKSKLERQHRCASEESNKQNRSETFTLADLQEEMKR